MRRLVRTVRFLGFFFWELLLANARVAWEVLTPWHSMRAAIVAVPTRARTDLEAAAAGAAVLLAGAAVFQVALALGLPLGDATLGGRAAAENGVLPGPFRVLAAVQAAVLLLFAWVVLARADVVGAALAGDRFVYWATWVIVGFLVLNTLGNLTAPHPVERWVMGPITVVAAVLGAVVAVRAPV